MPIGRTGVAGAAAVVTRQLPLAGPQSEAYPLAVPVPGAHHPKGHGAAHSTRLPGVPIGTGTAPLPALTVAAAEKGHAQPREVRRQGAPQGAVWA